ncbi:hypothetical protein Dda_3920 [Drechslerella dactyloides]|uniref:Uncharacterized protein n=1 Tax=Drechslerella dactyloides TaxID=74499 RepID=A0AAD6J3A0_DREDA|nr:hypothetical protein Dda_3920 [Drechslerella dactyloides]
MVWTLLGFSFATPSTRPRRRPPSSSSTSSSSSASAHAAADMRYSNEDRMRRELPNPQLPGEVPAKRPQCYCPPYPQRSAAGPPGMPPRFKITKYFTKYLFGDDDSDDDDFDDDGRFISRPTERSPKLFDALPVEILGQILDDVVASSAASDTLCRCFYPGVKVAELKRRYLRWKLADTRSIRETCSRWHSWASREYFSPNRSGVVVDFSDIDNLRLRLEAYSKLHGDEEEDDTPRRYRPSPRRERAGGSGGRQLQHHLDHTNNNHNNSSAAPSEDEALYTEEQSEGGSYHRRQKERPSSEQQKNKGISSFLSYYLLPEAADSKDSFASETSQHATAKEVDWSIVHKDFLTAFPYLRSGGVTLHLGSPLHIRNLEHVHDLLSTFAVVWGGSLLRNGGGIIFWDFTYAWREDTDVFDRLMNDPELGKERFLKYYDNPEREYWGIDEASWIMNPYQRPSMGRMPTNRIQQRFALSRRVHEFIIEQTISIIKADAELILNIITAAAGSSRIQVPVNTLAVLPAPKWATLKAALQACQTVEFRDWLYCNEQQFSRLATQLSELEQPGHSRQVWWDALDVTSRALNLEVDLLIEKMHDEFNRLELDKAQWTVPETKVKEIEVRGRGWMRSSHYTGGFVGKGHERRWLNEAFVRKFVFGQGSSSADRTAKNRGIQGLEKFLLADGCWAAEVSLGASLVLLQKSFSANTLRTLKYAPAIPQLSMSSRALVQPHACPLLALFPNLTDAFVYSVCCPEIFRAFLADSTTAPSYLAKLMATPETNPETAPPPRLPDYDRTLRRKWTIVAPRVHKSIARGCRDYSQETTFHLPGPSDAAQQEVHAEYLLKTAAWGLVWNRESLTDLLSAARQASAVLVGTTAGSGPSSGNSTPQSEKRGSWDLRIVFEGMVAVESLAYASGVNMPKYLGFESYDNLFFGSRPRYPHGSLDIKETVFYPLREPPMVEVIAKVLHASYLRPDSDDDEEDEDDDEEGPVRHDDGIRRAWMTEEDFLGADMEE